MLTIMPGRGSDGEEREGVAVVRFRCASRDAARDLIASASPLLPQGWTLEAEVIRSDRSGGRRPGRRVDVTMTLYRTSGDAEEASTFAPTLRELGVR